MTENHILVYYVYVLPSLIYHRAYFCERNTIHVVLYFHNSKPQKYGFDYKHTFMTDRHIGTNYRGKID